MALPLRFGRRLAVLFLIPAGLLVLSGCHKRPTAPQAAAVPALPPPPPPPKPEPFTGTLTEINGVQAVISFRHPKLISEDLGKLMTAIPETALLRPMLEQLAPFGYPEFSEIAAGSNVGVVFLNPAGPGPSGQPVIVLVAKLQEGGKIATLLSQQNMTLEKRGEWTLIAKDPDAIAKLVSLDGVAAFLEKPQTEDIRIWAGATPALIAAIKDKVDARFVASTAQMPDDKRKAALAYIDAAFSFLSQLHSAGLNLSLGDTGVRLAYWAQFKPDSPVGISLRYKTGPTPAVAGSIAADGVATAIFRDQPAAVGDLVDSVFNTLTAVDYPRVSSRLKSFKTTYKAFVTQADGGAAVLELDTVTKDGKERLKPAYFDVMSGQVSADVARDYFRRVQSINRYFTQLAKPMGQPGGLRADIDTRVDYTRNALTVDGVTFDSQRVATTFNGKEISGLTQYFGDAGGNIVIADSPATLEQRLPALLAGKPLPNGIPGFKDPAECCRIEVNGARLVADLAQAAKLDQTDPDVRAQIANLTAEYNASAPPAISVDCAQARADVALEVPYKFISATVHLSAYLTAQKFDLRQLFMPAMPAQARHRHAMPAPEQKPDVAAPSN